jgi:AP-2 complex subunit mu-1
VYVVAAVKEVNVDCALVFETLYRIVSMFDDHLGAFNDDAVMGNFVLIYELLDELIDFGYPQHTGPEVLKLYVTQKGLKSEQKKQAEIKKRLGDITGAISWRAQDIKYRRNEIFIDVLEKVNALYSPKGTLLESDVSGSIMIKAYLSGMPECRFGMNDKLLLDKEQAASGIARKRKSAIQLDDVSFHQCVKLNKFDTDRVVSFVPPDGEFELMKYRSTENLVLPFRLLPNVRETAGVRVDCSVSVKALFDAQLEATGVLLKLPCPPNTATTVIKVTTGKAKYVAVENAIVWKISRFEGGAEHMINAEVGLLSTISKKAWSRPPISLAFTVPMHTSSGEFPPDLLRPSLTDPPLLPSRLGDPLLESAGAEATVQHDQVDQIQLVKRPLRTPVLSEQRHRSFVRNGPQLC